MIDHMEYSVSSTNPSTTCSSSSKHNISMIDKNNSSCSESSNSNGKGIDNSGSDTVKVLDFKTASNLRRKPTNEMVHAKNLLKIFKDTFQNDIELDEHEVNEENETKHIKEEETSIKTKAADLSINIKTQVYENSKNKETPLTVAADGQSPRSPALNTPQSPLASTATTPVTPTPTPQTPHTPNSPHSSLASTATSPVTPNPQSPHTPMSASMIPRSMTPLGKPPMSPQSIRSII